jgi:hypothetical protein
MVSFLTLSSLSLGSRHCEAPQGLRQSSQFIRLDGVASLAMTIRVKKDGELPYLTIHPFKKPSLRSPAGAAAIQ